MQIQLFNPRTAGSVAAFSAPITRVKANWAAEWEVKPYLYCERCEQAVAPSISKAVFNYEYGKMIRPGETALTTYLPEDLTGYYVQVSVVVETEEVILWTGIIADEARSVFGQTDAAAGIQSYVAYGLEWLLDRTPVRGSVWKQGASYKNADWEPEFNKRSERGTNLFGNRATDPDGDGVYAFSGDGATWTMQDAVEYLLSYFGPASPEITLGGQVEMLAGTCPAFPYQGYSAWQAICAIVNPKRGMGAVIRTDGDAVTLHVYSALDIGITEGGLELPANAEICNIAIDADTTVVKCEVGKSIVQKMDKIVVRGERLLTCFTLPYAAGYLEKAWSTTEENAYIAGASGRADYPADADGRAKMNDEMRGRDIYRRVFSSFHVSDSWNWANLYGDLAAPTLLPDGTLDVDTPADEVRAGKVFERQLPLLEGYDYSSGIPVDQNPSGVAAQYRRPFALVHYPGDIGASPVVPAGWRFAEKSSDTEENSPGCTLKMMDTDLGIEVLFRPNHILALDVYDPDTDPPTGERNEPLYSYAGNPTVAQCLWATVAMRLNQRLTVERDIDTGDRELVIDVPGAEFHYLCPNTIYDIGEYGTYKISAYGGVLRDDSAVLNAIASLARAWYGRTRRTVSLTLKRLGNYAPVGALLSLVSAVDVDVDCGTVVSRVTWDFNAGTTGIDTAHVDLDVAGAVIAVDYPDERAMRRALTDHSRRLNELTARTADMPARGSL